MFSPREATMKSSVKQPARSPSDASKRLIAP